MTAITLMAKALHQELQTRGVYELNPADCEAIMSKVLERSAAAANAARAEHHPDGGEC